MSNIEYYFRLQTQYEQNNGDRTCIVMQVGSFYNIYEYISSLEGTIIDDYPILKNRRISESMGKAIELSEVLRMDLTSCDKSKPHSMKNPILMGFPAIKLEKYKEIILTNNYVMGLVQQEIVNGDVSRNHVQLISQATGGIPTTDNSTKIVSIYIEGASTKKNRIISRTSIICGVSCVDISTGASIVEEIYSKENNESYAVNEIYRFLECHRPAEVIININEIRNDEIDLYKEYLTTQLELNRYKIKVIKINSVKEIYFDNSYQEAILHKAFRSEYQPGTTNLIYDLDLESLKYGRLSFILLLQYCHEHDERIIKNLQPPKVGWTDQANHLILTYNAINQLNILPNHNDNSKGFTSIYSVINFSNNDIGARYLKQQLLNPITDATELNNRYEMTSELLLNKILMNNLDSLIKKIPDLERLQRQAKTGTINPKSFCLLFEGYTIFETIYNNIEKHCSVINNSALKNLLIDSQSIKEFKELVNIINNKVYFVKLRKAKLVNNLIETDENFIIAGQDTEIDNIQSLISDNINILYNICDHLNHIINSKGKANGKSKPLQPSFNRSRSTNDDVDKGEDREIEIEILIKQAKVKVIKAASDINTSLCGILEFIPTRAKDTFLITSNIIKDTINNIETYQKALERKLTPKYHELVNKVGNSKFFEPLINFIGKYDLIRTSAYLAEKYNYKKPTVDMTEGPSYISIKNMRHPLVERIIRTEYVDNDLHLNQSGLLVFGINSAGKSCMTKSPGACINLVQGGFYSPGEIIYRPFKRIITRLDGNDEILKGNSSFIVEMNEANAILKNADQYTLVLGDELCRGTETLSGTSLTVAMIITLIERKSCFIFSTHMHNLPQISIIKDFINKGSLQIKHLAANYDPILEQVIYNRKLQEGSGSSLYGLEVCKSLGMDPTFLEHAYTIRRELEGIPLLLASDKPSHYNKEIYKTECFFCKKNLELHTHHIKEQHTASENGFIGLTPVHANYNLLTVCSVCHQRLHSEKIEIIQQQTLKGINIKK